MVIETPAYRCFFCGSRFSADPEAAEGHFIHAWKVAACQRCQVNSPKVIPAGHPAIPKLEGAGIVLQRDAQKNVFWPQELQPDVVSDCGSAPQDDGLMPVPN
jgi:hypothetical protein